jgi:cyclopropane fatty-acyl-phospholipid synthase-like methyltransferase
MTNENLRARLDRAQFPRASAYAPEFVLDNLMGPNVLWLAEHLSEVVPLTRGMRVLDLGCGKAVSSIFFAREFGAMVWATDLWIAPTENFGRIEAAGVSDSVFPLRGEAHALRFAEGYFDAILSLDAYQYFGTDDLYLWQIAKFLKPGGTIGIVCPGVREEIADVPPSLAPYWEPDFCCFHSPQWWRRHWEKTGLVAVQDASWMPEGRTLWRDWSKLSAEHGPETFRAGAVREAEMLEKDVDGLLGFVRVVARKK